VRIKARIRYRRLFKAKSRIQGLDVVEKCRENREIRARE
jgi:hypothetical protein